MKKRSAIVASLAAGVVLAAATGVFQAQAVVSSISGTVSCTGTSTLYNMTRYLTRVGPITFDLTNSTGSTYGGKQTTLNVYIVNGGYYGSYRTLDLLADPVYPSSATLLQSGYLVDTAFRMNAHMSPSNGACDNVWAGKLNH